MASKREAELAARIIRLLSGPIADAAILAADAEQSAGTMDGTTDEVLITLVVWRFRNRKDDP